MRDAVELQGKHILYENKEYEINNFYFVPKSKGTLIYVRLKDLINKIYLNVPLSLLLNTFEQQLKI